MRLDAGAAEGKALSINLRLPDIGENYLLELKNSHLNNLRGVQSEDAGRDREHRPRRSQPAAARKRYRRYAWSSRAS
ncbi:alkyl sulfatase C-terminal domain-containing protein [Pseudomonas aeruginosa]|nr:alkyl sulfatase C-terminal domain-containing protein [Pseudomonas aeruginosa]